MVAGTVQPVDLEELQAWIDGYVRAWESSDSSEIGALFAEDALYYTHPFREPWRGRDAIVKNWTEQPDPPGTWECEYRAIAVGGDVGVVRGHTTYFKDDGSGQIETEYANVFVIELDGEGRAREFTEFFMRANPPPRT